MTGGDEGGGGDGHGDEGGPEPELEERFLSRLELFGEVDSTQRIVREWLEGGTPQVAVAVADVQSAGRGRHGRNWAAPPGAALLASCGFRPSSLPLRHAWRLAAIVALAMLDAAEDVAGLTDGTLWLKWPNDIVADGSDGLLRKVAGVLGETVAAGDRVESAVIGIGVNADWEAQDFPAELAPFMTSLRAISGGRPVDRQQLLRGFLARLEPRYEALQQGRFDSGGWSLRQRTTGQRVEISTPDGVFEAPALGVEPETGALLVERGGSSIAIDSGEVTRCRVLAIPSLQGGRDGRAGSL